MSIPPKKSRGNLKPAEIKPLVINARQAFDHQRDLGNLPPDATFDSWRSAECLAAVGKPGITACNHEHFRPLLAHFQLLSGRDGPSFKNLITTGPVRDHADPSDTHEARRILAHQIAQILAGHLHLATAPVADLSPALATRRAAIDARGKGPVDVGYLVWIARQKTRRPDLQLGTDWQAGLVDRCTVPQLTQLHHTLVNRIAAVEGTGKTDARNKAQSRRSKSPQAKAARDKNELDPPRW